MLWKTTGGMDVSLPSPGVWKSSKALILLLLNLIANLLMTLLEQNQGLAVWGILQRDQGAVVSKGIGTINKQV